MNVNSKTKYFVNDNRDDDKMKKKKKHKICIWMNHPSHHQNDFFQALFLDKSIDLQVRYFSKVSEIRIALGWKDIKNINSYEVFVSGIDDALIKTPDWKNRIHITMGPGFAFMQELTEILVIENVKWIHWSERMGFNLAKKVFYNMSIFKLIRPLFLFNRKVYGKMVNDHAVGAFAQGHLAKKDFISIGIEREKIANLYYCFNPENKLLMEKPKLLDEFKFKYYFIYSGSLCKRKGIDILLKSFAKNKHKDWGLILMGIDEKDNYYKKMAYKLGIENQTLFTGAVNVDDVGQYYHQSDILILPSRFDGWGAVLNEGAAYGLPLIATEECGSAYHMIKEEVNGYRVKVANIRSLATAMKKYIDSPYLIEKHGRESKIIFENFTPQANVNRFTEALNEWI